MPLPAQILTGRVVRFALWVRAQIPAGAGDEEVAALFEQAAQALLFPGSGEDAAVGAALRAKVAPAQASGGREVRLAVSLKAREAGVPFHFAFALPL